MNVGAAIIVKGTLVATPQAKQPFEIQAEEVQIEGASAPDYPLQKKRHSFEYLRTISSPETTYKYIPGSVPCTFTDSICNSQILPGERFCICSHTTDHWQVTVRVQVRCSR